MTPTEQGRVYLAMANRATERAEYYQARAQSGGRPAPAAEAVAWTLRAILMAGAEECLKIAKEQS